MQSVNILTRVFRRYKGTPRVCWGRVGPGLVQVYSEDSRAKGLLTTVKSRPPLSRGLAQGRPRGVSAHPQRGRLRHSPRIRPAPRAREGDGIQGVQAPALLAEDARQDELDR